MTAVNTSFKPYRQNLQTLPAGGKLSAGALRFASSADTVSLEGGIDLNGADPTTFWGRTKSFLKSISNSIVGFFTGAQLKTTWDRLKQGTYTLFDGAKFFGAIATASWLPIPAFRRYIERQFLFAPRRVAIRDDLNDEVYKKDNQVMQSVFFTAPDLKDIPLHGWYVPAPKGRPTIVFAHGRANNISDLECVIDAARQKNYGIFVFDYRGFGNSGGMPSEDGVYADLEAACETLKTDFGVDHKDQILMGHSLGGAIATDVAAKNPGKFKGLVLLSTFTDMQSTLSHHRERYWFVKWLFDHKVVKSRFDSISKFPKIDGPVVGFWGEQDTICPVSMGKALWEKRPKASPESFQTLSGTSHNIEKIMVPANIDRIFSAIDTQITQANPFQTQTAA